MKYYIRNLWKKRKKELVDPIVDKCQFIKSFIYKYKNEIVNDKNNILNNLIAADKKFDKFISRAIEKYDTCIYKWKLQNRSNILDITSYYINYTDYFMILIERNDPILTEINDLYSDFNYISNKLRRLGLNYYNIKLTDLSKYKIER